MLFQDDRPPVQVILLFEILVPFTKDLAEMLWCYLQSIRYWWPRDSFITCKISNCFDIVLRANINITDTV